MAAKAADKYKVERVQLMACNGNVELQKVSITSYKDGEVFITFNFKLPETGLALHSVRLIDGVPELYFTASRNVPTILEEDVATVFRLVSENKRPEFYYIFFPPTHPLHRSRFLQVPFSSMAARHLSWRTPL